MSAVQMHNILEYFFINLKNSGKRFTFRVQKTVFISSSVRNFQSGQFVFFIIIFAWNYQFFALLRNDSKKKGCPKNSTYIEYLLNCESLRAKPPICCYNILNFSLYFQKRSKKSFLKSKNIKKQSFLKSKNTIFDVAIVYNTLVASILFVPLQRIR